MGKDKFLQQMVLQTSRELGTQSRAGHSGLRGALVGPLVTLVSVMGILDPDSGQEVRQNLCGCLGTKAQPCVLALLPAAAMGDEPGNALVVSRCTSPQAPQTSPLPWTPT